MDELRAHLGVPEDDIWAAFPPDSPEGLLCAERGAAFSAPPTVIAPPLPASVIPESLGATHPAVTSTQEAMGRALVRLAEAPEVGERVVTLSPDVATSTHLAGWINKVGVFAPEASADYEEGAQRMLRWLPGPEGRHIELGISEMNLFMALGQFGLSYELTGQHLIPIGTVYDPFVCRGLDALIYGLYGGAKMIFAGTPVGRLAVAGGGRAPEHGDALARHRAAGARFLRAGLRPRSRMGAAGSAAPVLRPRARPLDATSGFRPSRSTRS